MPLKVRYHGKTGAATMTVFPQHESPDNKTTYFSLCPSEKGTKRLLVCVTMYNEVAADLQVTLNSIYEQAATLPDFKISVVVIMDGWALASTCMKNYITQALLGVNDAGIQVDAVVQADPEDSAHESDDSDKAGEGNNPAEYYNSGFYNSMKDFNSVTAAESEKRRPKLTHIKIETNSNTTGSLFPEEEVDFDVVSSPVKTHKKKSHIPQLSPKPTARASPPQRVKMSFKGTLDALDGRWGPSKILTVVLESVDAESGARTEIEIAPGKTLDVSFLIKTDNRRKHNSHEWFLEGFAHGQDADYLLLTDVETTFGKNCFKTLLTTLEEEPTRLCAAIGFHCPVVAKKSWNPIAFLHANAQRYEYYSTYFGVVPAFAITGFQPCIPGPCQMLRASCALNPEFLESYFRVVSQNPAKLDLLTATMCLAEDRPFTQFLYFSSGKDISYCPNAQFYSNLEVTPQAFLSQRRRWINGAVAASLVLLRDFRKWTKGASLLRTIPVCLLMSWYTFISLLGYGAPGLFTGIVFHITAKMGKLWNDYDATMTYDMPLDVVAVSTITSGAYFFTHFIIWTLVHHNVRYDAISYYVTFFVNMFFVVLVTAQLVLTFISGFGETQILYMSLAVFFFALPGMTAALFGDWMGIIRGSLTAIPYIVFLPVFSMVSAYSVARSWDLTWGNRPHDGKSKSGISWLKSMQRNYKYSQYFMWAYFLINLIVAFCLIWFASSSDVSILVTVAIVTIVPHLLWFPFSHIYLVMTLFSRLFKFLHII